MSIRSNDDLELPSGTRINPQSPGYSESQSNTEGQHVRPQDLKNALQSPSISSGSSQPTGAGAGYRAAEAYTRPSPIKTNTQLLSHQFDLQSCIFTMSLAAKSPVEQDTPTEIYLPDFHFPEGQSVVSVSNGEWNIDFIESGTAKVQVLRWWHDGGEQNIKIEGVKRKPGQSSVSDNDVGYIEQCQERGCTIM